MPTENEVEEATADRGVLTPHVRALAIGAPAEAEATWTDFWDAFCDSVKREIVRRGLWQQAPRYLGLPDAQSWQREALEELSSDAYIFLLERLRSLASQCRVHRSIDPLIRRNIRLFLFERQRACDPLGFRVFEVVRAAARRAVDQGAFVVKRGDPKVDNRTVLGAAGKLQTAAERRLEGSQHLELEDRAARWSDELLPDWLVARGPAYRAVVIRLADHFARLSGAVAGPFAFKDLVDPCKRAVRSRWRAIWRGESASVGDWEDQQQVVVLSEQMALPGSSFEARQSYERLVALVDEKLQHIEASDIARSHLLTLWAFLRITASEDAAALPSRRQMASMLGLPRYRMPFLFEKLTSIVTAGQRELGRPRPRRRMRI